MYKTDLTLNNVDALSNEFVNSEALSNALKEMTFQRITSIANELYYFTDKQLSYLVGIYVEVQNDKYLWTVVLN